MKPSTITLSDGTVMDRKVAMSNLRWNLFALFVMIPAEVWFVLLMLDT